MKRTIIVLLAGLLGGLAAHQLWFGLQRPVDPESLDEQLRWIRTQLQLNSEQYARIKELHEELRPRMRELGTEVVQTRIVLEEFEEQRRNSGQVDFVAFKEFVDQRRAVDRRAAESTRELVSAALLVMTPEQRTRYLALITPALDPSEVGTFH